MDKAKDQADFLKEAMERKKANKKEKSELEEIRTNRQNDMKSFRQKYKEETGNTSMLESLLDKDNKSDKTKEYKL